MNYKLMRALCSICSFLILVGCAYGTRGPDAEYGLRNYSGAFPGYQLAAENGNAHAQLQLGHMYALGLGVPADLVQAKLWDEKADIKDPKDAELELGDVSEWVEHDPIAALGHYQKAASLGNRAAFVMLAYNCENGLGVHADDATAQQWLHKYGDDLRPASSAFYESASYLLKQITTYSSTAMMGRDQGRIRVGFHYTGNGPATNLRIVKSQGDLSLDLAALLAVDMANMPKPPAAALEKGITEYQFDLIVTPG